MTRCKSCGMRELRRCKSPSGELQLFDALGVRHSAALCHAIRAERRAQALEMARARALAKRGRTRPVRRPMPCDRPDPMAVILREAQRVVRGSTGE